MYGEEKIVIELKKDKIAVLKIQAFDSELDIESILRIDYHNILGEILTFPVVFNRIANFKAEMENIVNKAKFNLEVLEAKLTEEKTKELSSKSEKRPTVKDVDSAVKLDERFKIATNEFFKLQKDLAYLESLYWSAQSKDSKLNRLSEKLRPEEFEKELIDDTINGVMIKMSKKVI